MPSGSHGGGGGGSHGGFSGGGGGRSSGGFGSSHSRPSGPRHIRWFGGRTVIISTGRQSALSILLVVIAFCLMTMIPAWAGVAGIKDDISMIKEEQLFYLDMVENAENNPEYQVMGKVTGVFYREDFEKYYVTYEFGEANYKGYTFSIYTRNDYPAKGSYIVLAVDDTFIDETTDSIPMDYKNYTLEDDGEYMHLLDNLKQARTVAIVFTSIFVALIAVSIVIVGTSKKKEKEKELLTKEEAEKQLAEQKKKQYCQYCGAKVDPKDPTCGQCGAKTL